MMDRLYPEFFRCFTCRKLSTKETFVRNIGCRCGGKRVAPSLPTRREEWVYLLKNPLQIRHLFRKRRV